LDNRISLRKPKDSFIKNRKSVDRASIPNNLAIQESSPDQEGDLPELQVKANSLRKSSAKKQ